MARVVASFQPDYVQMPDRQEADEIATHFLDKTGLPFVQGVIELKQAQ
jgi:hypothetical protein